MVNENKEVVIAEVFAGQGIQKPGMFKEFLGSPDSDLRNAGEEVIAAIESLGSDGRDIIDTYSNENAPSDRFYSTRYAQPGIAGYLVMYHIALRNKVGNGFRPRRTAGLSLGAVVASYAAGFIDLTPTFHLTNLRGKSMSPIEPGHFYTMTVATREPIDHISMMNWVTLRSAESGATIKFFPNIITISGRADKRDRTIEKLADKGILEAVLSPSKEDEDYEKFCQTFCVPFHKPSDMKPYANAFSHSGEIYVRDEEKAGRVVFKNPKDSAIVINGRVLTKGNEVKRYLLGPHIIKLCNHYETMRKLNELADYCVSFALPRIAKLEKYAKRGYLSSLNDLFDISTPYDIGEVADKIKERLERGPVPAEAVKRRFAPTYSHA